MKKTTRFQRKTLRFVSNREIGLSSKLKPDRLLEARSKSSDTLEAFYRLIQAEIRAITHERGVYFLIDRRLRSEPATMDLKVCQALTNACAANRIAHDILPSGAGHDASLFANAGIPSGMLFVRNQNGSHNPHEAMAIDDFMLGVQVLSDTVHTLGCTR